MIYILIQIVRSLIFYEAANILELRYESSKKLPKEKIEEMLEDVDNIRLLKALFAESVKDKEDKVKKPNKKEK